MQDAEALERITTELVETKAADGVRYLEIRWGPLLHVAGGLSLADGIAAVCAGARAGEGADRDGRAAHLHGPALARAGGQRDPGRDRGQVPRRGADRLGPGRTRGGASPTRWSTRAPSKRRARAACASPSTPASGAARPRSRGRWPSTPSASRTVPGAADDPALCAELIARGVTLDLCPTSNWQAGIVPSLAAHPLARLHRAGVPVTLEHGRHHGQRPVAVRRVRPGGRDDRADAGRAVGDRPARPRCRLRRRGRPRAVADRVRVGSVPADAEPRRAPLT